MIRPILKRTLLASVVAACVGCPSSLEDPARFLEGGPCRDVPQDVFGKICSTPGCHSTVDKMLGLDLQAPGVASRLIGVHAMGGTGLLIDPTHPAMSVLYTKLTSDPPFGVRMPFTRPPLDEATIACVLQWITEQVGDAGSDDGASPEEASTDDSTPGEDVYLPPTTGEDAAPGDATTTPRDAGNAPDARPVTRDASGPAPDASVRDAARPADAKLD
jgi:hypothetical protein